MEQRPIRVLYIYHVSFFGGPARSLIELISCLDPKFVTCTVVCPRGTAHEKFREAGIDTKPIKYLPRFDHTDMGYYRGLRWLLMLGELLKVPYSFLKLRALVRSDHWDIVHVNDLTSLLSAYVAKFCGNKVVVHARACLYGGGRLRRKFIQKILQKYTDRVIAISDRVYDSLPETCNKVLVRNGESSSYVTGSAKYRQADGKLVFGMSAVFNEYKGIYDFVEAAGKCVESGMDARFILFGDNARDKRFYRSIMGKLACKLGYSSDHMRTLQAFVDDNALSQFISLPGFTYDQDAMYSSIDVICFPGILDAIGRPVFEAGMRGIPGIVALTSDTDFLRDRVNMVRVKPGDVMALYEAMKSLYENEAFRQELGRNIRHTCQYHYDIEKTADKTRDIYTGLLSQT
jgi:glycosyltransferase involved in cell wall biosynthesis